MDETRNAPEIIWVGGQVVFGSAYWVITPPVQPELSQEVQYTRTDILTRRVLAAEKMVVIINEHVIPNAELDGDKYLIEILTKALAEWEEAQK